MRELQMIQRSLLLSAFVLLSSIIGGAPIALAATVDPTSFVSDLGSRALAQLPNEDTPAAANCSVSISTSKPAPVPLSGHIG
jgi:hypothetical protein